MMAYGGVTFSFATSPFYFTYFRDTNPYWILPGCLFQAVGGGVPVAFSMLYAIAADVTDEQNRCVPCVFTSVSTNTSPEAQASSSS